MTIYMITREFEYESSGGRTWSEPMADVDLGYFTSKETAEVRLRELHAKEAIAHRAHWDRVNHEPWRMRKEQYDRVVFQNKVLNDAGAPLTPLPHLYPEPVYKEWNVSMSDYQIVEIEPSSPEGAAS